MSPEGRNFNCQLPSIGPKHDIVFFFFKYSRPIHERENKQNNVLLGWISIYRTDTADNRKTDPYKFVTNKTRCWQFAVKMDWKNCGASKNVHQETAFRLYIRTIKLRCSCFYAHISYEMCQCMTTCIYFKSTPKQVKVHRLQKQVHLQIYLFSYQQDSL